MGRQSLDLTHMYGPTVRRKRDFVMVERSCVNVSGLSVEPLSLRAIMGISAHPVSLAERPVMAVWVTRS